MKINQAYYWKEKQQMADEFKIGTGYMPANGKLSSSNLHIHKERKKNANVNSIHRRSIFFGGRREDNHGYK